MAHTMAGLHNIHVTRWLRVVEREARRRAGGNGLDLADLLGAGREALLRLPDDAHDMMVLGAVWDAMDLVEESDPGAMRRMTRNA